jgi:DNA polymerase-3 subunit delta
MGAITLDEFFRRLKQGPPDPVYYFHGDEDVLKDEAVAALLDATVDAGLRDFNVDQRAAAELDAEALHSLLNTPPMLAERRLVVLRGVEQARKKSRARDALLAYLERPSPDTVLALVQAGADKPEGDLTRRATTVEVGRLPPHRVKSWIAHRAGRIKLTLEADAVDLLLAAAGDDLTRLVQELDKLRAVAGERPATRADVAAQVGAQHGVTVHDLADAVLARDGLKAAALVEPVLELAGMNGVRILSSLGTHLVGLALAREELDKGTGARQLPAVLFRHLMAARPYGLGDWKETADKWTRAAAHWSTADVARALRAALAADRALKDSGVTDEGGIVKQLVLEFAVPAREAA